MRGVCVGGGFAFNHRWPNELPHQNVRHDDIARLHAARHNLRTPLGVRRGGFRTGCTEWEGAASEEGRAEGVDLLPPLTPLHLSLTLSSSLPAPFRLSPSPPSCPRLARLAFTPLRWPLPPCWLRHAFSPRARAEARRAPGPPRSR